MIFREQDRHTPNHEDARGACYGSAGLASFAATVWALSPVLTPTLVLPLALAAWTATCALLWRWREPLT